MRITKASLDSYRSAVDGQANLAADYIRGATESYFRVYPNSSTAAARSFVVDMMKTVLPNFADAAETLSADFFDEIAESLGIKTESKLYGTLDYTKLEERVRYFAKFLNDGDVDRFTNEVSDVTSYFVKRSAFENMLANCRSQKVKWARVPSGLETCPFCYMLASRGFVYGNEKLASIAHRTGDSYHANCDCIVIPGFQDKDGNPRVKIEGYDPETMYRNWNACEKTVGGRKQARAEWESLSDSEREGYIARHGNDAKAFAAFEQNRILNELQTRDWHWLYTGVEPAVDYSKSPRSDYGVLVKPGNYSKENITSKGREWRDLVVHDTLAANGFTVTTRSYKYVPSGYKHIDLLIGGKLWEVKSPENTKPGDPEPKDPLNFIHENFGKANSQFRHQYDEAANKPLDYQGNKRVVLNMTYRDMAVDDKFIDRVRAEADIQHIDEVLLIVGDGSYGIGSVLRVK